MAAPATLSIGAKAPPFSLPGIDGRTVSLSDFEGKPVLVVIFSCNHCPTAQAYEDRLLALAKELMPKNVGFVAINSNDASRYPEDSFENMKIRAKEKGFPFPYLYDESQDVARSYQAVCTHHTFVFDSARTLQYAGRIDDNWKEPRAVKRQDLRGAISALLNGQPVPVPETLPMGCSIKWRF